MDSIVTSFDKHSSRTIVNRLFTFQPTLVTSDITIASVSSSTGDYITYLYVTIGSLGTIGNMAVFAVLLKNLSQSPNLTEYLILHQSFVDMLTSLFVILCSFNQLRPAYPIHEDIWNDFVCRFWVTQVSRDI